MTDIVVDHNGDASPDFVTDVVLYGLMKNVKYWDNGKIKNDIPILFPRVVVVKNQVDMRSYGIEPNLHAVMELFVMDGSETLIRAVTDTRLSKIVRESCQTLVPGSTLILKDFLILSMGSLGSTIRKIIVIREMSWRVPPKHNLAPVRSGLTPSPPLQKRRPAKKPKTPAAAKDHPEFKTTRLAWRALHKLEGDTLPIVFTRPVLDQPEIYIWNKMMNAECTETDLHIGSWIVDPNSRKDWVEEFGPKKPGGIPGEINSDGSDDEVEYFDGNFPCNCQCSTEYDFTKCVLDACGVPSLDFEYLLTVGKERCVADGHREIFRAAETWDDLPNNSKRWCCYFWYNVNVFQLRGCKSNEIPACVVSSIRGYFP